MVLADRIRDLVDERRRLLRQRRVHLVLLGLAVSLPVHMSLMIWLWSSHREMPGGVAPATVVLDLSILPDETLQDMLEPSESEDLLTPELATDAGAESLALERELQQALFKSADATEGFAAFNEKRTARFEGR